MLKIYLVTWQRFQRLLSYVQLDQIFFCVWKNYHVSIVFKKSCFFNSPAISYDFIQSHFFYRWWIVYFTRRYKQTFSILYSGGRNWYWNVFFKDLSKKDVNAFVQSKCLRCDQFFVNSTDRNNHNFLKILPIRWTSFFWS